MTSGSGSRRNKPAPPKITVTRTGTAITVTDGRHTRHSCCASPASARNLEARLTGDPAFAVRWMKYTEAEQLDLPLNVAPGVRATE